MSEHIATQAEIEDMIKGRIIHELVAELDNRFYLAYQGDNQYADVPMGNNWITALSCALVYKIQHENLEA